MISRKAVLSWRSLVGVLVASALLAALGTASAAAATPAWRMLAVTGPTHLPPFSSETQRIAVDAEGGTFTLSFQSQTTGPLAFNASPADVAAALSGLSSIGGAGGSVGVSGGPGGPGAAHPYFVSFGGALGGTNVGAISSDASLLTGGGASATVSTMADGGQAGEGEIAINATNIGGAPTNGSPIVVEFDLPLGITATPSSECAVVGQHVTCARAATVPPGLTMSSFMVPLTIGATAPASSTVELSIVGGGALGSHEYEMQVEVSAVPAAPGLQALWAGAFDADGVPSTQAGDHPNSAAAGFRLNTVLSPRGDIVPAGDLKDLDVLLPPGFIGNPLVTNRCPQARLAECAGARVGVTAPAVQDFAGGNEVSEASSNPVQNGEPPAGSAAQFTFKIYEASAHILGSLRSDEDFGVTVTAPNVITIYKVFGAFSTLEGSPPDALGKAFITNPSDCANEALIQPLTTMVGNTWQAPSITNEISVDIPPVVGCNLLEFKPDFDFQPTATAAATVTAATANLTVPQDGMLDPAKLASPHLKKSVVMLPVGLTLNPSAATGLQACTLEQIGFKGTGFPMPNPVRFDKSHPRCPDASKIGTVEIESPPVEGTLEGTAYLAAQDDNPFKSLLAMYLVVDDPKTGIVAKLPGEVRPDPQTGQLTAFFDNNPQVPFSDLRLHIRGGGPRSSLATPDVCGKYTTNGEFTPWSAPESGPPTTTEDSFEVTSGPGGRPCPTTKAQRPFAPERTAGTTSVQAGAYSPLTLRVDRKDGEQELKRLELTLPQGVTARLAGVGTCSDAAIAAAEVKTGKAEQANPSCPAASQVGKVRAAAGIGSEPVVVGGKIYRAGPYKGAPLSLIAITPAVAGPFDLGNVALRTPVYIDPRTAQPRAVSDEIPHILDGIPLQLRSAVVEMDRENFTLNPTSCEKKQIDFSVTGAGGNTQSSADDVVSSQAVPFQVGNCGALKFKPNLKLQLHGGTKRADYQRLVATVTYPQGPGYANIARAAVTLPHSAFLAQEHIRTVCTRVQFAAKQCPKGSVYGHATAITPLLDEPISGPVYLRSSNNPLPDLVAALRGPDSLPIEVELSGRTDSKNEGIRNTFDLVPDAPVSKFTLKMKGGDKSLIVNSRDLCKGKQRATVRLTAHNGKQRNFRPVVGNDCGKKKGSKGKKGGSKNGKGGSGRASAQRLVAAPW